jgi:glycosyltransferase involved in cell wall biosynthesis
MQKKNLAIIIPAFKETYLRETLNSLYLQTNQNFKVYIGDDNSPYNLWSTINDFTDKIDIVYNRFNENLGGENLVNHWERCIQMSGNEEWIWLFSDDDLLEPNCVETFFNAVELNPEIELFHFNVKVIDNEGSELTNYIGKSVFPNILNSVDFFEAKINNKLNSYIVEYVFSRSLYVAEGGIVNFDLAWCADDATWIKFARKNGIYTIVGAQVCWRFSGINISSIKSDFNISIRKINSKINYLRWVELFFKNYNIKHSLSELQIAKWLVSEIRNNDKLSIVIKTKTVYSICRKITNKKTAFICTTNVLLKELYGLIKTVLKKIMSLLKK